MLGEDRGEVSHYRTHINVREVLDGHIAVDEVVCVLNELRLVDVPVCDAHCEHGIAELVGALLEKRKNDVLYHTYIARTYPAYHTEIYPIGDTVAYHNVTLMRVTVEDAYIEDLMNVVLDYLLADTFTVDMLGVDTVGFFE